VNANRNFTNKLWNAGKFILFQLEAVDANEWQRLAAADFSSSSSWVGMSLSDRWVLSSLHQVTVETGPRHSSRGGCLMHIASA
jgi:valyl-tRNA synthetase